MDRTPESEEKLAEILEKLKNDGLTPEMFDRPIARMLQALEASASLDDARWLELVRSVQFLVQTQRLTQDKATSIVGRKDLKQFPDEDLDEALKTLKTKVAALEKREEKVLH